MRRSVRFALMLAFVGVLVSLPLLAQRHPLEPHAAFFASQLSTRRLFVNAVLIGPAFVR